MCVVITHLSCRRTEALRGGVVIGGGVAGSSVGGEGGGAADILMVRSCPSQVLSSHHQAVEVRERQHLHISHFDPPGSAGKNTVPTKTERGRCSL